MTTLSAALEARDEPAYDDASATLLDALDWIAKALPWLEIMAEEIQYELDIQETLIGPKLSDDCIKTMKSDHAALRALIARAEGEEVGE